MSFHLKPKLTMKTRETFTLQIGCVWNSLAVIHLPELRWHFDIGKQCSYYKWLLVCGLAHWHLLNLYKSWKIGLCYRKNSTAHKQNCALLLFIYWLAKETECSDCLSAVPIPCSENKGQVYPKLWSSVLKVSPLGQQHQHHLGTWLEMQIFRFLPQTLGIRNSAGVAQKSGLWPAIQVINCEDVP